MARQASLGNAAAVAAVGVWGFGNALVKYIPLSGPTISLQRLWLGAVLGFGLVRVARRRFDRRMLQVAAPGGLALGLNTVLFFSAVKYTSVTDATLIVTLQPVLVLLTVGRTFGERVGARAVLGGAIAFGGTALVILGPGAHGRHGALGDVLAVGALVTWAWYFVASKRARVQLGTIEYQAGLQLVAALTVTPVALLSHNGLAGSGRTWLLVLLLTTVPGSGHLLLNYAHRYVRLSVTSLLNLLTPVTAMVSAALLLHEGVSGLQVAGAGVVLAGLAVVLAGGSRTQPVEVSA